MYQSTFSSDFLGEVYKEIKQFGIKIPNEVESYFLNLFKIPIQALCNISSEFKRNKILGEREIYSCLQSPFSLIRFLLTKTIMVLIRLLPSLKTGQHVSIK
ncbi:hypothetical protein Avbf_07275 [Armadillidium vulgare]|nr:hypothetical protein Avbf_07275 [Armadillidium vulgare]